MGREFTELLSIRKKIGVSRHQFVEDIAPVLSRYDLGLSVSDLGDIEEGRRSVSHYRYAAIKKAISEKYNDYNIAGKNSIKSRVILLLALNKKLAISVVFLLIFVYTVYFLIKNKSYFLDIFGFIGSLASILGLLVVFWPDFRRFFSR